MDGAPSVQSAPTAQAAAAEQPLRPLRPLQPFQSVKSTVGLLDGYEPSAKLWGLVYFVVMCLGMLVGRRCLTACTSNQRNRLRDSYEDEYTRGGQLTNRLMLPGVRK